MKPVFVRPATGVDSQPFEDWSKATQGNLFDPYVPLYGSTFTLCAFNEDGPLVYMPVQQPFFLESLGVRPDADNVDIAAALKAMVQSTVTQAFLKGVGEIYFLGSNPLTDAFAERHGFEKLDFPIYRMKISELVKKA